MTAGRRAETSPSAGAQLNMLVAVWVLWIAIALANLAAALLFRSGASLLTVSVVGYGLGALAVLNVWLIFAAISLRQRLLQWIVVGAISLGPFAWPGSLTQPLVATAVTLVIASFSVGLLIQQLTRQRLAVPGYAYNHRLATRHLLLLMTWVGACCGVLPWLVTTLGAQIVLLLICLGAAVTGNVWLITRLLLSRNSVWKNAQTAALALFSYVAVLVLIPLWLVSQQAWHTRGLLSASLACWLACIIAPIACCHLLSKLGVLYRSSSTAS